MSRTPHVFNKHGNYKALNIQQPVLSSLEATPSSKMPNRIINAGGEEPSPSIKMGVTELEA